MPRLAILFLLLGLAACAAPQPPFDAAGAGWIHRVRLDHPLVGRIYDTGSRTFVTPEALFARTQAADHVLLGERHDNADHHRLQARVAQAVQTQDRGRTIAMEMLTPDQESAVRGFLAARPMEARGFGDAVGWGKTGWPDWAIYQPIGDVALAFAAPIVPANLTRQEVQTLRRDGPAALEPGRRAALDLDAPIPAPIKAAMAQEIAEAHCSMLPPDALDPFVTVQWARDAAMATAMLAGGRSILIAGAGHVRNDWGAPFHIAARRPAARLLSIAFVEVSAELADPAARDWPYDLVWFTPRVDEIDFCVRFRERMKPGARPAA